MSKTSDFEMQNPLYGVQRQVVQDAIRRAHKERAEVMSALLRRFSGQSIGFMRALCPDYAAHMVPGLTSFRPAEIAGRTSTWRKDDTRLHVDAFPSRPNQGRRILRFFANVNPSTKRIWRAGEPFDDAARDQQCDAESEDDTTQRALHVRLP